MLPTATALPCDSEPFPSTEGVVEAVERLALAAPRRSSGRPFRNEALQGAREDQPTSSVVTQREPKPS